MKYGLLILWTLLVMVIISCNNKSTTWTDTLEVKQFSISEQLLNADTSKLRIDKSEREIRYRYREKSLPDTTYNYLVVQNLETDTLLTFFGDNCYLIDKRIYKFREENLEVRKYLLDTDIFDNETALYFMDDYGLIILRSIDWGNYYTFDKGLGFEKSIIMKIKNDSTDFF